ncbi:Nodulation protein D 2 [compost metagenome]
MPHVLSLASKEAPGLRIQMKPLDSTWSDQLDRGEVDIVIIPDSFMNPNHPSERLFEDRYCCVAWKENSEISESLTIHEYHKLGHVIAQISEGRTTLFDQWFLERYGQVRRVEVTSPYFSLLPALIVGTNRIATVHYQLAKIFEHTLPISIYEVPFDVPPFIETVQYHKHFESDPVSTWFRGLLHKVASNLTESRH